MEKLVTGFLNFQTEVFGRKKGFFRRLSESIRDIWVYDFDSERFTSLPEKDSHRLKAAR